MSEAERLDREIAESFRKAFFGEASSQELSRGYRLLRERANFMMPKIYTRSPPHKTDRGE